MCCNLILILGIILEQPSQFISFGANNNTARISTDTCTMLPADFLAATDWQFLSAKESLRAFFESSGFAAEMRQDFADEVQRAGDQDRIGVRTCKHQRVANRGSDGVGE